jgi:hypothetical protein
VKWAARSLNFKLYAHASLQQPGTQECQSGGLWTLRVAHRGCAAPGNVPTLPPSFPYCAHTKPEPYWEPQSDLHCLVHAYNTLQGDSSSIPQNYTLTPAKSYSWMPHTCTWFPFTPGISAQSGPRGDFPSIVSMMTASPHRTLPSLKDG